MNALGCVSRRALLSLVLVGVAFAMQGCTDAEGTPLAHFDAGPMPLACGDGICALSEGEHVLNCAVDCPDICGDGMSTGIEACDSNTTPCEATGHHPGGMAACLWDCTGYDPSSCRRCGDDVCDPEESTPSCPGDCSVCGDGETTGSEACDDAMDNGTGEGFCDADCAERQSCGDGELQGTEACDAGDTNGAGPGICVDDCSGEQVCGDGVVNGTEFCDASFNNGLPGFCDAICASILP